MHSQQTKPPAATTAPLTAVAMEDDKDKQEGSPPLSPTCLTNVVKDIMDQPLAPKTAIINNQIAEAAKWIEEVWQQRREEDSNSAMATAMTTGMRTAMRTSTTMAMAKVTVMATTMAQQGQQQRQRQW
jgi:hypothetical protein